MSSPTEFFKYRVLKLKGFKFNSKYDIYYADLEKAVVLSNDFVCNKTGKELLSFIERSQLEFEYRCDPDMEAEFLLEVLDYLNLN